MLHRIKMTTPTQTFKIITEAIIIIKNTISIQISVKKPSIFTPICELQFPHIVLKNGIGNSWRIKLQREILLDLQHGQTFMLNTYNAQSNGALWRVCFCLCLLSVFLEYQTKDIPINSIINSIIIISSASPLVITWSYGRLYSPGIIVPFRIKIYWGIVSIPNPSVANEIKNQPMYLIVLSIVYFKYI